MVRLKDVFDRAEVLELLDHLRGESLVKRLVDDELGIARISEEVAVGATDEMESRGVYWLATNDHPWWHVHH